MMWWMRVRVSEDIKSGVIQMPPLKLKTQRHCRQGRDRAREGCASKWIAPEHLSP